MKTKEHVLLRMKEDIILRGLSKNTLESYILNARIFLDYCNRPVEQLNEHDIRNFLCYLINEKKVKPQTVNTYSASIRFLFAVTLNRTLNYLQIPHQKKRKTLPEVLTREEVSSIIGSCLNIKHMAMLMVVYSSGLCVYRPKHPEGWLFLGTYNVSHITSGGIESAFNEAVKRANIAKNVSIHSLRHGFATHLLEDGATLLQVKELLAHSSIQTTTVYLHLANLTADIKSPLDKPSAYRSLEDSLNG